jgi:hypothetical protein
LRWSNRRIPLSQGTKMASLSTPAAFPFNCRPIILNCRTTLRLGSVLSSLPSPKRMVNTSGFGRLPSSKIIAISKRRDWVSSPRRSLSVIVKTSRVAATSDLGNVQALVPMVWSVSRFLTRIHKSSAVADAPRFSSRADGTEPSSADVKMLRFALCPRQFET